MVLQKKALEILDALRGQIPGLRISHSFTVSREFTKWQRDVDAAIQHIFPNKWEYLKDFRWIMFTPGAYDGRMPKAVDARAYSSGLTKADAILESMADQVRLYWAEQGNSLNPQSKRLAADSNAPAVAKATSKRTVFVVHGRNEPLRKSMFDFLRAIGLKPLEWSDVIAATSKTTPYIGQVLDIALSTAQAVVVLMTPDDDAHLRQELQSEHDPQYEKEPTGQARPNVLFEAGMAMGRDANRTVLVEIGNLRPFSDIGGRHVVRLNNSPECRQDLADRLKIAGCDVDLTARDWLKTGSFDLPAHSNAVRKKGKIASVGKDFSQPLQFEAGAYWKFNDGKRGDGPFCPVCYETDKKSIRLYDGSNYGGDHQWFCLVCHNGFGGGASCMSGCSG